MDLTTAQTAALSSIKTQLTSAGLAQTEIGTFNTNPYGTIYGTTFYISATSLQKAEIQEKLYAGYFYFIIIIN